MGQGNYEENSKSRITAAGGKYVVSDSGRVIEYSVHGKLDDGNDVPIIVSPYCAEYLIFNDQRKENPDFEPLVDYANVDYKLISISLPGIGNSDIQYDHRIADWPQTDLLPILEQENVTGSFHMCGVSLGTLYAVATAQVFPDRILSLGLRVPFLPLPVSVPLGLPNGQPTFPTSQELEQNTFKVRVLRFFLSQAVSIFSGPGRCTLWLMKNGFFGAGQIGSAKFFIEHKKEAAYLSGLVRYFPANTMMLLVAKDVGLEAPGVDPREVSVEKILMEKRIVWYAADDHDCPPSHGKWLAEIGWKGCHTRVYDGYDHSGGAFLDYEEFLNTLVRIGK